MRKKAAKKANESFMEKNLESDDFAKLHSRIKNLNSQLEELGKPGKLKEPVKASALADRINTLQSRIFSHNLKIASPETLKAFFVLFFLVGAISIFVLPCLEHFTAKVIFDISQVDGEPVAGTIKLKLGAGELLPADSVLALSLGDMRREISLKELISGECYDGEFYAEASDLSGYGCGYGTPGIKDVQPYIDFVIVINKRIINATVSMEVPYLLNYMDFAGGILNDGIAIANVQYNGNSLSDDTVKYRKEGGQLVFYTDYSVLEPGFGKDYLGDGEIVLDINISSFNLIEDGDMLFFDLLYNGTTILHEEKELHIAEIVDSSAITDQDSTPLENEEDVVSAAVENQGIEQKDELLDNTVQTTGEVDVPSTEELMQPIIIGEMPAVVRIPKNMSHSFDMSSIFSDADSYYIIGRNISLIQSAENPLEYELVPDAEFSGAISATLVAVNGNMTAASNDFTILVSKSGMAMSKARAAIRLNEPVKWTTNISLGTVENITVTLPQEAENISVEKIVSGVEKDAVAVISEIVVEATAAENATLESTNLTSSSEDNSTIDQYDVISIGQDDNSSELVSNLTKEDEDNISASYITGNVVVDLDVNEQKENEGMNDSMESAAIEVSLQDNATKYIIEYYTDAPTSIEELTDYGKVVTISGPDELNYTDVLSYANIQESVAVGEEDKIRIYWREGNMDVPFDAYDMDENGLIDYIEWIVPHLSNQTFEIILITRAIHLDSNRALVEDVYDKVSTLDGIMTTIPAGHYLRVTFEKNLTSENDNTIYASSAGARIEVYPKDSENIVAVFEDVIEFRKYRVILEGLQGSEDTFDLKIIGNDVTFDYVVDPKYDNNFNTSFIYPIVHNLTEIRGNVISSLATKRFYSFATNESTFTISSSPNVSDSSIYVINATRALSQTELLKDVNISLNNGNWTGGTFGGGGSSYYANPGWYIGCGGQYGGGWVKQNFSVTAGKYYACTYSINYGGSSDLNVSIIKGSNEAQIASINTRSNNIIYALAPAGETLMKIKFTAETTSAYKSGTLLNASCKQVASPTWISSCGTTHTGFALGGCYNFTGSPDAFVSNVSTGYDGISYWYKNTTMANWEHVVTANNLTYVNTTLDVDTYYIDAKDFVNKSIHSPSSYDWGWDSVDSNWQQGCYGCPNHGGTNDSATHVSGGNLNNKINFTFSKLQQSGSYYVWFLMNGNNTNDIFGTVSIAGSAGISLKIAANNSWAWKQIGSGTYTLSNTSIINFTSSNIAPNIYAIRTIFITKSNITPVLNTTGRAGEIISSAQNYKFPVWVNTTSKLAYIGQLNQSTYFTGQIDEVSFFNYNLSTYDILQLYNGTVNNSNFIGKYANVSQFTPAMVYYGENARSWNITMNNTLLSGQGMNISVRQGNNYNITSGLIGLYSFDNDTYQFLYNISGVAINKTGWNPLGFPNYTSGIVGKGIWFNGSQYAHSLTNPQQTVSLSVWIAPGTTSGQLYTAWGSTSSTRGYSFAVGIGTNITFSCIADGVNNQVSLFPIDNTKWNHIVVIKKDSIRKVDMYLNGVLVAKDKSYSASASCNNNGYVGMSIGNGYDVWDNPNNFFVGGIDELRLYNYTLSADEALQLYQHDALEINWSSSWTNLGNTSNMVVASPSKFIQYRGSFTSNNTNFAPNVTSWALQQFYSNAPQWQSGSPYNATFYENQSISQQINATDDEGILCYYLNDTRFTINCSGYMYNNTPILHSVNNLTVRAVDTEEYTLYANFTITMLEVTKPIVRILYPENGSEGNVSQLNFTAYDVHLDSCWFDINGTNVSTNCTDGTTTCGIFNSSESICTSYSSYGCSYNAGSCTGSYTDDCSIFGFDDCVYNNPTLCTWNSYCMDYYTSGVCYGDNYYACNMYYDDCYGEVSTDCSQYTDETNCTTVPSYLECYWDGDSCEKNSCDTWDADESTCQSVGCSWADGETYCGWDGDVCYWDGDSCENRNCYWDVSWYGSSSCSKASCYWSECEMIPGEYCGYEYPFCSGGQYCGQNYYSCGDATTSDQCAEFGGDCSWHEGCEGTLDIFRSVNDISCIDGMTNLTVYANDTVGNIAENTSSFNCTSGIVAEPENSIPVISSVTLTTTDITKNDTTVNLTGSVDATDTENDAIAYLYNWYKNDTLNATTLITEGLVAYYPLNNDTKDYWGNIDATNSGATGDVEGRIGNAYSFGGDDYIGISDDNSLDFDVDDNFSILVWVNMSTDGGIIQKGVDNNNPGYYFFTSSGQAHICLIDGSGNRNYMTFSPSSFYDNNWHLLTFTYDGLALSTSIRFYLDSFEIEGSSAYFENPSGITNSENLKIGSNGGGWFSYLSGQIDEIQIYSITLSADQVSQLYWAGVASGYTMNSSQLTAGDVWKLGVKAGDANAWSDETNATDNIMILPGDYVAPGVTIDSPLNISYNTQSVDFNLTLSEIGDNCTYNLDAGGDVPLDRSEDNLHFTKLVESISETTHTVTFLCNDSAGNINNTETITFTVDLTYPGVTINSPSNISYNTQSVDFNLTLSEPGDNCTYNLDSSGDVPLDRSGDSLYFTKLVDSLTETTHTVTFWCNDTAGNINNTETITFTVDLTYPSVTIDSPLNISYNTQSVDFNLTLSEPGDNCTYNLDSSGDVPLDRSGDSLYFTKLVDSLTETTHTVTFWCNDTAGNINNTETITFTVDLTYPGLTINSPFNETYHNPTGIEMNITLSELGDTCTYNIDSVTGEVSMSTTDNLVYTQTDTGTGITAGTHTVVFTCNDTAGNINNTESRIFSVLIDSTPPGIQYDPGTPNDQDTLNQNSVYVAYSGSDANGYYTFVNYDNSLVGWWRFEGNADDESGYGSNGQVNGATLVDYGRFGKVYSFDGSYDYIQIPHTSSLKPASSMTISAWVKPTSITTNPYYEIYRKEDGNDRHLLSFQDYGTVLSFGISTDGSYVELDVSITSTDYTDGWHHVVATYNGSLKSVYRDGVEIGSAPTSGAIGTTGSADVYIGSSGGSEEFFYGNIDEVMIFNRSLSAEEIVALYDGTAAYHNFTSQQDGSHTFKAYAVDKAGNKNDAGLRTVTTSQPINEVPTINSVTLTTTDITKNDTTVNLTGSVDANDPENDAITYAYNWYKNDTLNATTLITDGLVAYYPLNNDSLDYYGSNDGSENGGVTLTVDGKISGAYDFAGDDDYISVPDSSISIGNDGSISLWAKLSSWDTSSDNELINNNITYDSENSFYLSVHYAVGVHWRFGQAGNGNDKYLNYASSDSWESNTWHHLVITWNYVTDTSYLALYADGVLVDEDNTPLTISVANPTWNLGKFLGGEQQWLTGSIDEVQFWNRKISADEVSQLYYAGVASGHTMISSQLTAGDVWRLGVKAGDANGWSEETNSSDSITILGAPPNQVPNITSVTLNTTDITLNDTNQNLTGYIEATDNEGDNITYAYNWYKDGALNATTLITDGLVGYWPLNNDTMDYYSTKDGTNNGATANVAGIMGNAYSFDENYIELSDTTTFGFSDGLTPFSLVAWIKFNSTAEKANTIMAKQRQVWCQVPGYSLTVESPNNYLNFWMTHHGCNGQSITVASNNLAITNNEWTFVAITYNGSGNASGVKLYKNGQELSTNGSRTQDNLQGLDIVNAASFKIGYRGSDDWTGMGFVGDIDEPMVFNRSLSAAEVSQLYWAGVASGQTMISSQLTAGDVWTLGVKAGDANGWSEETNSSDSITILGAPSNQVPNITSVTLNTTDITLNDTNQNLTGYVEATDNEGDNITYAYNWYKNDSLNATTLITDGLVAYYPLNNDTLDYYNSYDGSDQNEVTATSEGKIGGAYSFDGSDRISLNSSFGFNNKSITVSLWVYIPSTSSHGAFFEIGNADGSVEQGDGFAFGIGDPYFENEGNKFVMLYERLWWGYFSDSAGTGWHHFAVVINDSGKPIGYEDGSFVSALADAPEMISPSIERSFIGGYNANGGNRYYTGSIDEVMIFNRSLSAAEISQLYWAGVLGGHTMNSSRLTANDVWKLGVKAADSTSWSEETNSSEVTIIPNGPPTINSVTLTTTDITKNDTTVNLTGSVDATDTEGDNITYAYNWYKNDSLNATTLITDGLVAYYPLNNDSFDYYGSNDGTSVGTSLNTTDYKIGGAALGGFANDDIANGYGKINITGWQPTTDNNPFTVSLWANVYSLNYGVASFWGTWADAGGVIMLGAWDSNRFIFGDPGSAISIYDADTMLNKWNLYSITFNGTNLKVYINENLSGTQDDSFSSMTTGDLILMRNGGGAGASFDGLIDEVQIYNRTLSADEISQLYWAGVASGYTMNSSQLIAGDVWKLGVKAADSTSWSAETNSSDVTILASNVAPNTTQVILNSSSLTNYTDENLTCYANITDVNGGNVYANYTWYKNGVANLSGQSNAFAQGTIALVATLAHGNTTNGDIWNCSVQAYDATVYEGDWNNATLTILNKAPTISSVILNTTNITLNDTTQNLTGFVSASDADSHNVTYAYNWYKNNTLNATTLITNGLVAYWPLNNDTNDYYGANDGVNNGAFRNTTTYKMGTAYTFDGIDDFINISDSASLRQPTTQIAISMWVYLTETTSTMNLFRKYSRADGSYGSYTLWKIAGNMTFSIHNQAGSDYPSWATNNIFASNTWYHLTFSWSANNYNANDGKIFVNGQEVSTIFAANGYTSGFTIDYAAYPLYLGRGVSTYFNGTIDEFMIFNRSLNASEVSQLYWAGVLGGHTMNSSRLTANDVWKLGVKAADSTSWSAETNSSDVTILASNVAPNTTQVILNSSSLTNYTDENLTCYANITDVNGGNVYANYTWYKNGVANLSGQSNAFAQGTIALVATLAHGNTTNGDIWNCSVQAYDATAYEGDWNNATLTILNKAPTISSVVLNTSDITLNDTTQNLTGFVSASDADSHNVTYAYNWYKNNTLNATTLITNGLVAYYPLNNDTLDYYSGFDGTNNGATYNISGGKMPGAYSFDGLNDIISVSDTNSLSFVNGNDDLPFTISVWINMKTSGGAIVSKGSATTPEREYVMKTRTSNSGIVLTLRDYSSTGQAYAYTNTTLLNNTWYHIIATYNGEDTNPANGITIYVNGVNQTAVYVNEAEFVASENRNVPLRIGDSTECTDGSPCHYYFNGTLDELMIWNRSLSAAEVSQLYWAGVLGGHTMNSSRLTANDVWKLGVKAADSTSWSAETNSSNVTILSNLDSTSPILTVVSPLNDTYDNQTVEFNVSLNENASWCGYSLDGDANQTMDSVNSTYFTYTQNGISYTGHTVVFTCNDTSNNFNSTSIIFTVDLNTPATVVLNQPPMFFNFTSENVTFNFTYTDNEMPKMNCTLVIDNINNNTVEANNNTLTNINIYFADYTVHRWKISCNDSGRMRNSASRNFTVIEPVTIIFNGTSTSSLTLTWNNTALEDEFVVYSSTDPNTGYAPVQNISSATWQDNSAGTTSVKFYRVATKRGTEVRLSPKTIGSMEYTLHAGWNLISFPVNLSTWNIRNGSNNGSNLVLDVNGCVQSIYKFNSNTDSWGVIDYVQEESRWSASVGSENFTQFNAGESYYLEANQTCKIRFYGYVPQERMNVSLLQGYNLAGWYSVSTKTLGENAVYGDLDVSSSGCVRFIYQYNTSTESFDITQYFDDWGWWNYANEANGGMAYLAPGEGYWFEADNSCGWNYDP